MPYVSGKGTSTPWGRSQGSTTRLAPGICYYSTASHGGISVSRSHWHRMSEQAIARGIPYGGRLWYEEDCDWAIVVHELHDKVTALAAYYAGRGQQDIKQQALETLMKYHQTYLNSVKTYRQNWRRLPP